MTSKPHKKIPAFTKENIIKSIKSNFNNRLKGLNTFTKPNYKNDAKPNLAQKFWELSHSGIGTPFYVLTKNLGIHMHSIEGWEQLQSVLCNLVDDSYFGMVYTPSENELPAFMMQKEFIYVGYFSLEWVGDSHPSIVYESEWADMLDWYIHYAKNEFVYDESKKGTSGHCKPGPTHRLSVIDNNWHEYPPCFKKAYDAYKLDKSK